MAVVGYAKPLVYVTVAQVTDGSASPTTASHTVSLVVVHAAVATCPMPQDCVHSEHTSPVPNDTPLTHSQLCVPGPVCAQSASGSQSSSVLEHA